MLRIYWNINTPIHLKSGQSIPLGLYPKSLGFYEMNDDKTINDNDPLKVRILFNQCQYQTSLLFFKHVDSIQKRSCYDDTILTRLSLNDENDPHSSANLRRVQTIRLPSTQRKTVRMSLPTFLQSSTDDDEVFISLLIHRSFSFLSLSLRLVHSFQPKTV